MGPLTFSQAKQTTEQLVRIKIFSWGVHCSWLCEPGHSHWTQKTFLIFNFSTKTAAFGLSHKKCLCGPASSAFSPIWIIIEWCHGAADDGRTEWIREHLMSSIPTATQPVRRHFPRSDKAPFIHSSRLQSHYSEHNEALLNRDDWGKNGNLFPLLFEEKNEFKKVIQETCLFM